MRDSDSLLPVMFALSLGFVLLAALFLSADLALAQEVSAHSGTLKCSPAPNAVESSKDISHQYQACQMAVVATAKHRQKIAATRPDLDKGDQLAALRSVQFALSNLGDGASYVWHRGNGRLSGVIQPTQSFKDDTDKVCRHVIVKYTAGDYSRAIETVACRRDSGVWVLSG